MVSKLIPPTPKKEKFSIMLLNFRIQNMYPHAPAIDLASPYNIQSLLIKTTRLTLASTCSVIMIRLPTVNLTTGSHTQATLKKKVCFLSSGWPKLWPVGRPQKKNVFLFFFVKKMILLSKMKKKRSPQSALIYSPGRLTVNNIFFKGGLNRALLVV